MDTYMDDNGTAWISCDYFTCGDYGGYGTVGEANIRRLEELYPGYVWVQHGAYFSRQAWLLDTKEYRGVISAVEHRYCVLSDSMLAGVEMEWERAAWDDWLRSDLLDTLPDGLGEVVTDDMDDAALWAVYRAAMDATGTQPHYEYSACFVRTEDIAEVFGALVLAHLSRMGGMMVV